MQCWPQHEHRFCRRRRKYCLPQRLARLGCPQARVDFEKKVYVHPAMKAASITMSNIPKKKSGDGISNVCSFIPSFKPYSLCTNADFKPRIFAGASGRSDSWTVSRKKEVTGTSRTA
mmetsp:Transcript_126246/g.243389  ORF Transcript_126246/g.243389 Transcript_126246/m.243389 type:complete len:117 (+) Transcript_126246:750-1100(+)